jgi:hypothetical protein
LLTDFVCLYNYELEEKSVKTTINIKKENIISAGRVINMDKLVNKDFYNIQTYR